MRNLWVLIELVASNCSQRRQRIGSSHNAAHNAHGSEPLADLGRFSQLLEETEHLHGLWSRKVAKIVHCGEHLIPHRSKEKAIRNTLTFCFRHE
jgi:hypothetical protein